MNKYIHKRISFELGSIDEERVLFLVYKVEGEPANKYLLDETIASNLCDDLNSLTRGTGDPERAKLVRECVSAGRFWAGNWLQNGYVEDVGSEQSDRICDERERIEAAYSALDKYDKEESMKRRNIIDTGLSL